MQLYKFQLQIESAFATIPKGDTLFGQFCWQIVQNFGTQKLESLLSDYKTNPFAIISDILPQNSIRKPPVPNSLFGIKFDPKKRKEYKAKSIIKLEELEQNGYQYDKAFIENHTYHESAYKTKESIVIRNSINRLTSTTRSGFDPFANYRYDFHKDKKEATLYMLLDERLPFEEAKMLIEQIGTIGFGKDATIGRGKFKVVDTSPHIFKQNNTNALITLSPSILSNQGFQKGWYETFTRFGKHGSHLSHSLVWKNPILMAESFALLKSDTKPYIGMGLGGDGSISKALPQTVHQGYAITIPISLELNHETVSA